MKKITTIFVALLLLSFTGKAQTFTDQITGTGLERTDKIGEIRELFDYNNDGFEDIIYSTKNSFALLYKNNGNGTFTDASSSADFPVFKSSGTSLSCFDIDNNGFNDLVYYFSNGGTNVNDTLRIFMNYNGVFSDKTAEFGISNPVLHGTNHWNSNIIPFDFDRDGDLDILFASTNKTASNACNNSKVSVLVNKMNETSPSFNTVIDLITYPVNILAASLGVTDYNNDQLADFVVIEQSGAKGAFDCYRADPFELYKNNGNSTFTKVNGTNLADAALHNFITVWDYNNDGFLDFINGTSDCCGTRLNIIWKNNGNDTFNDMRSTYNLHPVSDYYGRLSAVDYNNDGNMDISTTNLAGFWSDTRHQLWENSGVGFVNKASINSLQIGYNGGFKGIGSNSEWFDYDNDGDLDFYTYHWNDGGNHIQSLMNNPNSSANKYLRIKLVGTISPKDGIGSRVVLKSGNQKLTQYNNGTIGNNLSTIFHFGLGQNATVDSLFVYWSSGKITKMANVTANQLLTIEEEPVIIKPVTIDQISQFGNSAEQNIYGMVIKNGNIYISGDNAGQSLLLKYPVDNISVPNWIINWPNVTSVSEGFYGVTADENGVYTAGLSYSQTVDNVGGKEHKSIICKFPLTGATGSNTGGADWIAKPTFFSYGGYESLNDISINVEQGVNYIYACGSPQANGLNNVAALLKYDCNNNLIWSKILGNTAYGYYNTPISISILNNNIYVASCSGSYLKGNSFSYITLWKYDSAGNLVWNKSTSTIGFSGLNAICSYDQSVYVVGYDKTTDKGNDVLVIKYDEEGNVIWQKRWGGSLEDIGKGVELINNKLLVVGETSSFGSGGKDAFVLKLDVENGALLDSVFYGGPLDDVACKIKKDGNTIYISGTFQGDANFDSLSLHSAGSKDIFILKMNSSSGHDSIYNVTAGTLSNVLTKTEKDNLTRLKLSGTIDARDFRIMRDSMPALAEIDLSLTTVVEYTGTEGTNGTSMKSYSSNSIPQKAFYNLSTKSGKSSLKSFTFPASGTTIDDYAFRSCGLTSITIPSAITTIGYGSFYNCNNLKNVTFMPSSQLSAIETYAFGFCNQLTTVEIPPTVTSIGDVVFLGSAVSVTVDINNSNYSSFDGLLFNKDKTRLIYCSSTKTGDFEIPSTVITIAVDAFYNCNALSSIKIPPSVTTLDEWAFENCYGLSSINIPSSVTTIKGYTFYNCWNLSSIYANAIIPVDLSSSDSVFNYVNKNTCILYVPVGSKLAYQTAYQWKDFVNIKETADFPMGATASDYYLPLCVGNYTKLHTSTTSGNYCDRSTKYTYIKTDTINGIPYLVEEGWEGEYPPGECVDTKSPVFHYLWLRKDDAGNIMMGAIGAEKNDGMIYLSLDSAMILPEPMAIFPNSFLIAGSFISYPQSDTEIEVDTVVSVTATVGPYTNCIQVRAIQRNTTSGIVSSISDSYYAYHVGLVRTNRTLCLNDGLFDSYISDYLADNCSNTDVIELKENSNFYSIYPNPVTDGFYIKTGEKVVTITVSNLNGSILVNKQVNLKDFININYLTPGIYIVKLSTENGLVVRKLVKK